VNLSTFPLQQQAQHSILFDIIAICAVGDEEEKKKDKLWGIEFNFPWFKKKKE
jgi:hypothetical protein